MIDSTDLWSQDFFLDSPAFHFLSSDLRRRIEAHTQWPDPSAYQLLFPDAPNDFREHRGCDMDSCGGYEAFINQQHCVPTRTENWHDFFNAMIWHHYPQSKAMLNQLQCNENHKQQDQRNCRTGAQNILTRFDESGAICLLPSDLATALREKNWKYLFHKQRRELQSLCEKSHIRVFGHGLFEKCRHAYIGLCAHAIIIECEQAIPEQDMDSFLCEYLREHMGEDLSLQHKLQLFPLPLLGLPEWHPDNAHEEFFNDSSYFR